MTMDTFYIEFDTKNTPANTIQAVRVDIGLETIADMQKSMDIGLSTHPLFQELLRYCDANRPGRGTETLEVGTDGKGWVVISHQSIDAGFRLPPNLALNLSRMLQSAAAKARKEL